MDSSQELSAWDVVNGYSERELIRILREYGEEYRAVKNSPLRLYMKETKKVSIPVRNSPR